MRRINRKLLFTMIFASLVLFPMKGFAVDYSGGIAELLQAIQDSSAANTFTATSTPINATQNFGSIQGTTLSLYGGESTLDGLGTYSGMFLAAGKTLRVVNFGSLNPDGTVNTAIQGFVNTAVNDAGFINNDGATGKVYLTNSVFYNNVSSSWGGVIDNRGILEVSGSTFLSNRANVAASYGGGALFNYGGTATVTDSLFKGNTTASNGGAIYSSTGGALTVTNSIFGGLLAGEGNTATGSGGAISSDVLTTITGSQFIKNQSAGGGAISLSTTSGSSIKSSTFTDNVSTAGGGAIVNTAANLLIDDSTFKGNHSSVYGGAINNTCAVCRPV